MHLPLTLNGFEQLHALSIKSQEKIPRTIFTGRSPLSSLAKLLNLWKAKCACSQEGLNNFFSLPIALWIDLENYREYAIQKKIFHISIHLFQVQLFP